jgi:glycosyltransferase involved in cell wall biosynthesis
LRWRDSGVAVAVFAERRDATAPFIRDDALGYPVYRAAPPHAGFRAVLDDWRPDVAIYPFGRASLALIAYGLQAGVKAALHVTNVESNDLTSDPSVLPEILLIANSAFTARRIATLLGASPSIVAPLIEPERYRVSPTGDAVLLVNPTVRKGVEIFFRLAAARPDIPFLAVESWTIGDAWRTVLINRARALGNVELWPSVEDMREALARARLVLMPSIHEETFGRVVAEAQVSGIPALVSDRGALPETLGGGGLVVPLDAGIEPWVAALDRLWSDPAVYQRCAAAALAESTREDRAPDRIAARFLDRLGRF